MSTPQTNRADLRQAAVAKNDAVSANGRHGLWDSDSAQPDIEALLQELDGSLRRAEQSVHTLHTVSTVVLGASSQAQENRAIVQARLQLSRQRFEQVTARYESLRTEFIRLRDTVESRVPRTAPSSEPQAVRHAAAYIDANAGGDITLADICARAGVGPRALQQAFRRHRDTTPLAYLRTVRYQRAHEDLQAASPTDSVADIAHKWGFFHLSHFAEGYRRRYGQSPRITLKA